MTTLFIVMQENSIAGKSQTKIGSPENSKAVAISSFLDDRVALSSEIPTCPRETRLGGWREGDVRLDEVEQIGI